jgi:hypothetical protein
VGKEPLPGSWSHPTLSATGWAIVTVAELSVFRISYLRGNGLLVLSSEPLSQVCLVGTTVHYCSK